MNFNRFIIEPTEPIFHQCADIKIQPNEFRPSGLIFGLGKFGPAYAPSGDKGSFVTIDIFSGDVYHRQDATYYIGQRGEKSTPVTVANGLMTPSVEGGILFFGYTQTQVSIGSYVPVYDLYHYSQGHNNFTHISVEQPVSITQWAALGTTFDDQASAPYYVVGQSEDASTGTYTFSVFWLSPNGSLSPAIATTPPDQIYVNFFWAEYSACAGEKGQIYLLVGDENSLTALNAKLFVFDVATGSVSVVQVDNSKYTISSVHAWSNDCSNLYTLSPGLVINPKGNRQWNLVTINPQTGAISNPMPVGQPGEYTMFYGGSLYGKSVNSRNQLPYVFQRTIDHSFELKLINLDTGNVDSTTGLNLGVNSIASISSLTYIQ